MMTGAVFDRHCHPVHQLAWTDAGVLEVVTDDGVWVLPPTRALWLPANLPHQTSANAATLLRGIYLDPGRCPIKWRRARAVAVNELLAALLRYLSTELTPTSRSRAEALVPDLLQPLDTISIRVAIPTDDRAREVAEALLADPADPRTLTQWGRAVGASARTLTRGFHDGTGVSFNRWRTSARIRAALPLLATGTPISQVATAVGYETASAFVAAFRREVGTTPGAYFSSRGSPRDRELASARDTQVRADLV